MARTPLPIVTLAGPYAIAAGAFVWTASDVANGNSFAATGREIVLFRNAGATLRTLTITATNDDLGRAVNLVQTIAAGIYRATQMFPLLGWAQSTGVVFVDGSHAELELAVLRLP